MINEISEIEFYKKILEDTWLTIAILYSQHSGSFFLMLSKYLKLSKRYNNKICFYLIKSELAHNIKKDFSISHTPVMLILKEGRLINKIEGMVSNKLLEQKIMEIIDENE